MLARRLQSVHTGSMSAAFAARRLLNRTLEAQASDIGPRATWLQL